MTRHIDEQLNLYGLGTVINGDNAVAFVTPNSKYIPQGWADLARKESFMDRTDKIDKREYKKHLGRIELMSTTTLVQKTSGADLVKSDAVLELDNPFQVVSYEIAIPNKDSQGFRVVQDSDLQNGNEPVGVDGSPFYIYLDKAPTSGDFLKFDLESPFQVQVSTEIDSVTQEGDKFKVWVVYQTNNQKKDFPRIGLKTGSFYEKTAHPMPEYGLQWSTPTSGISNPGYVELEWTLGSPHGVETYWTKEAGNLMTYGATEIANKTAERLNQEIDRISGRGGKKTLFVTGRYGEGNRSLSITHISTVMEILTMAEAYRIEAMSNMFSVATLKNDFHGGTPIKINEGAWLQARRGKIITYPRPNALGVAQLQEASNYYYKNSDTPINQRKITFVGGMMAVQQGQALLNNYATQVFNTLPAGLTGTESYLKDKGLITGTLDKLKLGMPEFAEVLIPGVGWVKFEHDASFDYKTFETGNTIQDGFYGLGGFNKLSYSLMVKGMDYKGNTERVKNATLVENGNRSSNLYYVVPKEGHVTWGYDQGRMNNGSQYSNIQSSSRYRGQTFWVEIHSGMLMLDVTRNVIIELDNTYMRS